MPTPLFKYDFRAQVVTRYCPSINSLGDERRSRRPRDCLGFGYHPWKGVEGSKEAYRGPDTDQDERAWTRKPLYVCFDKRHPNSYVQYSGGAIQPGSRVELRPYLIVFFSTLKLSFPQTCQCALRAPYLGNCTSSTFQNLATISNHA